MKKIFLMIFALVASSMSFADDSPKASLSYFFGSGSCSSVPSQVKTALQEAQNFSQTCPTAKLAPGKYYAINDYTGQGSTPQMYIFDQSGNCVRSMPISWGVGSDRSGALDPCSTESSHQTPPGFHITATHEGAAYNDSNSIGLAGLSGQDSLGKRGILIHPSQAPGTACSWGCTGVPVDEFADVKQLLGVGSVVYNYFGENPTSNCSDKSGLTPTCNPEPLALNAAAQANGQKSINYRAAPATPTTTRGNSQ